MDARLFIDARLQDIFFFRSCEYWYVRDDEGPSSAECKRCFWGVPLNQKAILKVKDIVVILAHELEELLPA